MNIPINHVSYTQGGGTASSAVFKFPNPPRDPGIYDTGYPLYQGWVNTATGAIWYLESFTSQNGVITALWRAVGPIVLMSRVPTTADYLYPIGQTWVNTTTGSYWVLVAVSVSNVATWIQISGGGGNGIDSLTGNSGGAVFGDSANNVNVVGDGTTIDIVGDPSTNTLTVSVIGGAAIDTIDGDTGSISGSTVTIYAHHSTNNCGSSVEFVNSGTVSTLNVTDANSNTIIGKLAGSLSATGSGNVSLGKGSLPLILGNSYNIAVGVNAGSSYTSGNENSNIVIGYNQTGTNSESNVLRLGVQGTGNGQQSTAYISGIVGNTVSNPELVTINSSTTQLGNVASGDNGVLISSASGVPSWLANGTAGYVLTASSSAPPTWQPNSAGTLSVVMQVFTSSGTYTPTSGMVYCIAEAVGGGGGGGGAIIPNITSGGGGGGGGGYARSAFTAATIGASQTVTIGGAGTAGSNSGGNGGNGGQTSLGSILVAGGGLGGTGANFSNLPLCAPGGNGGAGSTGQILTTGTPGGLGFALTSSVTSGGAGGSSFFGGGGAAIYVGPAPASGGGNAGVSYGGGGSGASTNGGSAGPGGVGYAGIVVVTEYVL